MFHNGNVGTGVGKFDTKLEGYFKLSFITAMRGGYFELCFIMIKWAI